MRQTILDNLFLLLKQTGISQKPIAAIGDFEELYNFATLVKKAGFKIVAVSDKAQGLVDYGGNGGLNISKLITRNGFNLEMKDVKRTKPNFIMKMEVDVLIPGIIKGVIDGEIASEIRAKVVIETKKGLVTREAKRILEERQIPVISLY